MKMKKLHVKWFAEYNAPVITGLLLAGAVLAQGKSIVDSKHNLSVGGPGTVKAALEDEVCIFCHTPHNASADAPLWNRYSSGAVYTPYSSSTAKATIGQPTGASKLCLSCHDGTVALGMVRSRPATIDMGANTKLPPGGRSNLGTDLRDDHPVSFTYDSALATLNGELNDPAPLLPAQHPPDVSLDKDGMMHCTACHDPHDDTFGNFLVKDNQASALCITCHDKDYWTGSDHRNSTKTWSGSGTNPWPNSDETTVADNACGSCHTPHDAGSSQRLLNYANEENNCYPCHNSNVAAKNIQAEFSKTYTHPISSNTGVHDPAEDLLNPSTRHVECVDCHNPHAAKDQAASAPAASGALSGVAGINTGGSTSDPIANEYELCFRCHADSIDRGSGHINRQFPQTNTRLEFSSSSASYHPVTTIGKNPDVPSLISPWTTSSIIYCTDCHNNNNGPNNGGSGPNGPHGSSHQVLLERNLRFTNGASDSTSVYALCYKCHSRTSIRGDKSFKEHQKHIDEKISCLACHDPHGVQSYAHLINFNLDYVTPFKGVIEFVDGAQPFEGSCTLVCHGEEHDKEDYKP